MSYDTKEKLHMERKTRTNQKIKRRRRRRPKKDLNIYVRVGVAVLTVVFLVLAGIRFFRPYFLRGTYTERSMDAFDGLEPEIDVQLLTENPYSRSGYQTSTITGVVIHYTANPGSSAQNNRDYFESLKDTHANKVSSNFVVGLEGEIIQCVPTWEVAYASNNRNWDTVSIECCHPDETGKFNENTYQSVIKLTAWLCLKFGLDETDVIRHYDVTGKNCPKYYVENPESWEQFRHDVKESIASLENSRNMELKSGGE